MPYLRPECGDHKVIWELNRHQHWLVLGRAYWLTGDRRYRTAVARELASWMDANPPLVGINWASMLELAFRSISWVWAAHFFAGDPDDDTPWLVDLVVALDRQLVQIERNLSYYFSPNTHLLGEALALYVCGRTLPWLAAAARYERIGRTVLLNEISRQIAGDGGHRERSAHYHRYTLDFYLLARRDRPHHRRSGGGAVRRRGRRAWVSPPACLPTTAACCPTSETTTADRRGR